jgi:hypothetical protein
MDKERKREFVTRIGIRDVEAGDISVPYARVSTL